MATTMIVIRSSYETVVSAADNSEVLDWWFDYSDSGLTRVITSLKCLEISLDQ